MSQVTIFLHIVLHYGNPEVEIRSDTYCPTLVCDWDCSCHHVFGTYLLPSDPFTFSENIGRNLEIPSQFFDADGVQNSPNFPS
jgi:hypothetical protein